MSELEVQGLVRRINRKLIVDHVSFHIKDDEFFVLLGPSDSGKTTILRMICGFDQPDEGCILLNGKNIVDDDAHGRNIAVVFQNNGLFPHMTVFENLAYGFRFQHLSKDEVTQRVKSAAGLLELTNLLHRQLSTLSGGEAQRTAIGRALVKNAEVYLFDEPISQLDPPARRRTRQEILMVHNIRRKPCIYITQDQTEAFNMAHRVALIANGKIHQIGTPDELRLSPASVFVAKFLNDPELNIMEGFIHHVDTRYRLRAEGIAFTFPRQWTPILARLGPQSKLIMGIRPSSIVPQWAFDTLVNVPHIVLPAQITRVGPLMGKRYIQLTLEQGTEISAELKESNHDTLLVGQIINIAINPEKILFFHPTTEELLNPTGQIQSS